MNNRVYTIRLTVLCLVLGILVAGPVGLILYQLSQPLTVQNGQVSWTFGAFAFPLALFLSGAVLAGSVFILPARFAQRAGRKLDPTIWPVLGVFLLTGVLAAAFILGILLGAI